MNTLQKIEEFESLLSASLKNLIKLWKLEEKYFSLLRILKFIFKLIFSRQWAIL